MKHLQTYKIGSIFILSILLLAGCSKDTALFLPPTDESRAEMCPVLDGNLNAQNEGDEIAATLQYKLYYFRKEGKVENPENETSEKYEFEKTDENWMDYDKFCQYLVDIEYKNLDKYDYRLIAIATPKNQPEIEFFFHEKENKILKNLSVRRTYKTKGGVPWPLSKHNYIGVGNITKDAVNNGIIPIEFQRAVGQLVFDIYKFKNGTKQDLDDGYNSTLDRVHNIRAKITNYTHALSWDLKKYETNPGTETCDYDLSNCLTSDYKIDWVKTASSPIEELEVKGATRIYGPYLLATNQDMNPMEVELTFEYADTYIPNGEAVTNTLVLNLPKGDNKLPVKTDYFTRTTIMIPQNRIIDVQKDFDGITINPSITN